MLKLYGPQRRDELRLRDVSLQQEAQLPPYEDEGDEEAAEDVAFLYSDDPAHQQPKPYSLPQV
jgi:hypothetical protein